MAGKEVPIQPHLLDVVPAELHELLPKSRSKES